MSGFDGTAQITEPETLPGCPFCDYAGPSPVIAEITVEVDHWPCFVIEPINPVTPGHILVVPRVHVEDFTTNPHVTADVMRAAAEIAKMNGGQFNLITSKGPDATQTVAHLHVHLIPRRESDGLQLPWTDPWMRS